MLIAILVRLRERAWPEDLYGQFSAILKSGREV
jgi:hypothetical protein